VARENAEIAEDSQRRGTEIVTFVWKPRPLTRITESICVTRSLRFSATLCGLCTANRQNSFSVREFSQRFAEPLNRSNHVPVQRREHGERRESQRSYQRFRAGKSATTSVSASPQSSSARLCAALRSPRFKGHNRSHCAEAGRLRQRLRDRSFGCGRRLRCVLLNAVSSWGRSPVRYGATLLT
jgi:hypothetical protein